MLVFAPGAPINFTNAYYIRDKLQAAIAKLPEPCRLVVIEANGVINFDFTGADIMQQIANKPDLSTLRIKRPDKHHTHGVDLQAVGSS